MKWRSVKRKDGTVDPWAIESYEPEGYTIAKVSVWTTVFYEAWHGKDQLMICDTADKAKQVCADNAHVPELHFPQAAVGGEG